MRVLILVVAALCCAAAPPGPATTAAAQFFSMFPACLKNAGLERCQEGEYLNRLAYAEAATGQQAQVQRENACTSYALMRKLGSVAEFHDVERLCGGRIPGGQN